VEVVLHVKKCGEEIPKMWIVYNFVKKFTRFIFFVNIFRFICTSDFTKILQSLLLEQNSNNKICHFLKNAKYSF